MKSYQHAIIYHLEEKAVPTGGESLPPQRTDFHSPPHCACTRTSNSRKHSPLTPKNKENNTDKEREPRLEIRDKKNKDGPWEEMKR